MLVTILSRRPRGQPSPAGSTPVLSLSTSSLSFSATEGGADPSDQAVTISNSGGGSMNTPTVGSVTDPDGILNGTPVITGTGPWTLTVSLSTGALTQAGSPYSATIPVVCSNASNSPQNVAVSFAVNTASTADGPATLPTVFTTTFALASQSGTNVHTVTTSAEFVTALSASASEDDPVIIVAANIDKSSTYTLPQRTGAGWCYIVSDYIYNDTFERAPGVRARTTDTYRRLRTTAINNSIFTCAVQTNPASNYWIAGLEMTSTTYQEAPIISIGGGTSDSSQQPDNIVIDRCYIWGTPGTVDLRRGIAAHGRHVAVINCDIRGIRDHGNADSQAIALAVGEGPYKFVNNYMEAAGENLISGGQFSQITPQDMEFKYNYVYKDPAWEGVYPVKNLLELKFMFRALIEGNIFENCWASGQSGNGLLIKSTCQNSVGGGGPVYKTTDITYRYNIMREYKEAMRLGSATEASDEQTERLSIHDNVFVSTRADLSFSLITNSSVGPIQDLSMKNNIIENASNYYHFALESSAGPLATGFVFEDNIVASGGSWIYGPFGASGFGGSDALDLEWSSYSVTKNAVRGTWTSKVVSGNTMSTATTFRNIFTDYANDDWSVATGNWAKGVGTGGADPGPDLTTLASKTQYTLVGDRPSESWGEGTT